MLNQSQRRYRVLSIGFRTEEPIGGLMLPLVEIPPFINEYAENYQDLFSPEQFEHFKRYLSGLFISDNKTIQAINGLFVVRTRNQSSLNRFFTEYPWSAMA